MVERGIRDPFVAHISILDLGSVQLEAAGDNRMVAMYMNIE